MFTPDTVTLLTEAHEVLPGSGPDMAAELAKSPGLASDKEFLQTHIQGLLREIEVFETRERRRAEVLRELSDVKKEKESRVGDYQNRVKDADKTARDNLNTLVGYGFNTLGQGTLESIIALANNSPNLSQQYPISLTEPLTRENKTVLTEILSRLTGIPKNELLESDGLTLCKDIDEKRLVSAFKRTGVMNEGIVDTMKIKTVLQKSVENNDK